MILTAIERRTKLASSYFYFKNAFLEEKYFIKKMILELPILLKIFLYFSIQCEFTLRLKISALNFLLPSHLKKVDQGIYGFS